MDQSQGTSPEIATSSVKDLNFKAAKPSHVVYPSQFLTARDRARAISANGDSPVPRFGACVPLESYRDRGRSAESW